MAFFQQQETINNCNSKIKIGFFFANILFEHMFKIYTYRIEEREKKIPVFIKICWKCHLSYFKLTIYLKIYDLHCTFKILLFPNTPAGQRSVSYFINLNICSTLTACVFFSHKNLGKNICYCSWIPSKAILSFSITSQTFM